MAAMGIWAAMGIEEGSERCLGIQSHGEAEMEREFRQHGCVDTEGQPDDGFGSDWARFEYAARQPAAVFVQPNGKVRDLSNGGKTLDDFLVGRRLVRAQQSRLRRRARPRASPRGTAAPCSYKAHRR